MSRAATDQQVENSSLKTELAVVKGKFDLCKNLLKDLGRLRESCDRHVGTTQTCAADFSLTRIASLEEPDFEEVYKRMSCKKELNDRMEVPVIDLREVITGMYMNILT